MKNLRERDGTGISTNRRDGTRLSFARLCALLISIVHHLSACTLRVADGNICIDRSIQEARGFLSSSTNFVRMASSITKKEIEEGVRKGVCKTASVPSHSKIYKSAIWNSFLLIHSKQTGQRDGYRTVVGGNGTGRE